MEKTNYIKIIDIGKSYCDDYEVYINARQISSIRRVKGGPKDRLSVISMAGGEKYTVRCDADDFMALLNEHHMIHQVIGEVGCPGYNRTQREKMHIVIRSKKDKFGFPNYPLLEDKRKKKRKGQ